IALAESPYSGPGGPIGWTRAAFDLDGSDWSGNPLDREGIEVVIHAAAWTDVDGCAREPALAMRRNGEAVGILARACAERGLHLVLVSTNEVFDGRRTDGRGYAPDDPVAPPNPYGASKLAGERAALAAYDGRAGAGQLDIVRTAWLFGPGAPDFPAKILAAAARARASGEALRLVADEWGSPTYVADLAEAVVELVTERPIGPAAIHHVVNAGVASRADWAREVLRASGFGDLSTEDVPSSTWPRPSTPPRWGVLEPTPLPSGEPLRSWQEAMADYAPLLRRAVAARSVG
ncbi:MAG TPA: NAD(P)-dependent oxidoreductase, partial [Candidatus Limnocylindrales bacterium]|nr:NAD(P)-dependent oxidoreductase [Candidatus Limnocylindrales bacterium]